MLVLNQEYVLDSKDFSLRGQLSKVTAVLFSGLNVCTFKISYHQGTLPLSSPGGRGVNVTIAIEEFNF